MRLLGSGNILTVGIIFGLAGFVLLKILNFEQNEYSWNWKRNSKRIGQVAYAIRIFTTGALQESQDAEAVNLPED